MQAQPIRSSQAVAAGALAQVLRVVVAMGQLAETVQPQVVPAATLGSVVLGAPT